MTEEDWATHVKLTAEIMSDGYKTTLEHEADPLYLADLFEFYYNFAVASGFTGDYVQSLFHTANELRNKLTHSFEKYGK